MKVSTILDFIDGGHMALPEFQRGYVWNRDQVRGLIGSLYRRHPVGSLLVWATESKEAEHRGDKQLASGIVKLLLDGQQRITTLYGIIRGRSPEFFDGDSRAFTDLFFNLESEEFSFYMPKKMAGDPLWVDVTRIMVDGIGPFVTQLSTNPETSGRLADYINNLNQIHGIREIDFHVEEVTGADKTIDVVVDIFNRVNSGGTKLSKGDLALAKVCAAWPDARTEMRKAIDDWFDEGYRFDLDWLLRNINTIATGEARFNALHDIDADDFRQSLNKAVKLCNYLLNVIAARLGLDHDRVLFGRYAFPVLVHYIDRHGGSIADETELNKLLFWYLHSGLWGKFSNSTESTINKDLELIEEVDGGMDRLIEDLQLWRGDLHIQPEHFGGWSRGARFYPLLYLLTRTGDAQDWGLGIPLRKNLLGKNTSLEVHHIFPRNFLKKHGYNKAEINAVANFCFLTKDTNLKISDKNPEVYFQEITERYPGALESQWIPMDRALWRAENYLDFLEERKRLLAGAANTLIDQVHSVAPAESRVNLQEVEAVDTLKISGGITEEWEEAAISELNEWMKENDLPRGEVEYELVGQESGDAEAILDLAWPGGVQSGYSESVALLLEEGPEVVQAASRNGFRVFTDVGEFKTYVKTHVLGDPYYGLPEWAADVEEPVLPIVRHLIDANIVKPECGYELQNNKDEVIGEFELAWPQRRIGIWTLRGNEYKADVHKLGWLAYDQQEIRENLSILNNALGI
ncbi:MAG: DUF262 domain-containing protein [gamma proteobacterium endosymbiont of Lamellibrachia anaximandri]|nr:DUF262 domain-containing protein [gamma proteobacterium endosymbiont of Lamellibrachia anaximandri]